MAVRIAAASVVLAFTIGAAPHAAFAQANVMKECGAEYQAAKAGNALNGQKWNDFLAACRTRKAASNAPPATTAPAAPATASTPAAGAPPPATTTSATPAKPAGGGRAAMLERQKACGAEWKEKKVDLRKADPGLKWPKYWSDCNKRLKAAGR